MSARRPGPSATFDDDAASVFSDNTGGWGSGTASSRPVNFYDGTVTFREVHRIGLIRPKDDMIIEAIKSANSNQSSVKAES